ncbi:MAG: BrnT family toxin [Acidobacteriota bacterium]
MEDRRKDYGERRVVATGVADGIRLTVVYTDRKGGKGQILRRIISAHRSNRRERAVYQEATK